VAEHGQFKDKIESFKDPSIRTGHFLIDLLSAADNTCINYDLVEPGETGNQLLL
jgi:hypothetical protein